ncbi:hypothetical protein [Haloferula sp.]|uniref:hypothetical protein n=1 Tax=Haloferula sp. TaxID=2497595 RepID=UPI00329C84A1
MFRRVFCLILALLALGACDRAKDMLGEANSGGVGNADVTPGGDVSESLESLVLREGDGVKFRRDLPFPARLEVRMIQTQDFKNVRVVEVSAFGKSTTTLDYMAETEIWCGKNPGLFDIRLEKAGRRVIAEEEEPTEILEIEKGRAVELEGQSLNYVLSKGGWRTRHEGGAVDFKKAVWADSLEGNIPYLMVETGAHPRAQWFSSSRVWTIGAEIVLTGNALKILDPYDVSGRVTLKFEGVEAVGGHPCGVFSMVGDMKVRDQIQVDGSHHDADITVTAGKIWASLLHPVLLREEYETVQTLTQREGKRGGPETKLQGAIDVKKCRNWSPVGE